MPADPRPFVERLFVMHRSRLQRVFYHRVRTKADAADLAQEVYLRMLRVPNFEAIENPELYLFTVARNLAREHAVLEARRANHLDIDTPSIQDELEQAVDFPTEVDRARQRARLTEVLRQLSPKCRAVVVLRYRHGYSYEQIAGLIGVSTNMVKKYLVQGLALCRRRMGRYE